MTDPATNNPVSGESDGGGGLEAWLQHAEITECKLVPWGSNYTFAVVMTDSSTAEDNDIEPAETIGIYKPRAGEAPLWDFPSGTLYLREYCSYVLTRALGWDFIPPTVIRDGPHGIGTVQLYVEPEDESHYFAFREQHGDELRRMAVFDLITNNADRKAGHCFRGKVDRRVWGIDHGLTFHVHPKLRTVIWDFCGEPIPERLIEDLIRVYDDPSLFTALRPHLDPFEVEALRGRIARVVDDGVFPQLTSRREIPYGW